MPRIRRGSWIWEVWFAAENPPIVQLVPCTIFAKHSRWGVPKTIRGRKQPSLKKNAGWFWSSLRRPQAFGLPLCADEFGRGSMHRSWRNAARKRGTRQLLLRHRSICDFFFKQRNHAACLGCTNLRTNVCICGLSSADAKQVQAMVKHCIRKASRPLAKSLMRGLGCRRRYWSMQKSLCANGEAQTLRVSEAYFPGADWLKALDDGQLCRLDRQIGVQAFLQHIPSGAVPPYSQCRW